MNDASQRLRADNQPLGQAIGHGHGLRSHPDRVAAWAVALAVIAMIAAAASA